MKDRFGHTKPVQIMTDEWWYNGHIIIKQDDFRLPKWVSFPDTEDQLPTTVHGSKKDAIKFSIDNPISKNKLCHFAEDYL